MLCPDCQGDTPDGARFCMHCAAPLPVTCSGCGAETPKDARFCPQCAHPLARPGAGTSGRPTNGLPAAKPPPGTSSHLVSKSLRSGQALEGERKQVTVLFADVKGSMDLAEQLDPEEWSAIMRRFVQILAEAVERYEGFVDKFTGDGIMALFGAPIAHEDHAQRACYAALHLQRELTRYATELKREHGLGFSTRVGIHTGEVVVGRIGMSGDELRMEYTAQGHAVGLAQRMEALASPDSCYLTAATADLAGGYFDLEDLGEFRIKGVAEAIRVHRLGGTGPARNRFDVSLARGLSRFIGRAADLATLDEALSQTAAGNGQVVGVVAEAGTGKSRLCFEFLERCRARGMRVYEGRAVAHGRNIPLLPILELFRDYFGITLADSDEVAREKIAGRMVVLDQTFAHALPLVFDFLGVADPLHPAPSLDPEVRQRQLLEIMRQATKSSGQTTPSIMMIEDLHWLDEASAEFLEHMVDARAGTRSLLLLNFRPEYHAEWMKKSWYRQIPLTPLGRDAIAELLADLLGDDPSIASLATPIHARTAGNPFFAEEVVRSLIESGHLQGSHGAYRQVIPVERLEVPATVQAVLAARIDRLAEREKRLLQVASVIGKDFPEPLLARVAGLPTEDLKASLAALCQAEFLHEHSIYPVVEYAFRHPLTQEVALGSQLRQQRREVHAAVARAVEEQDAGHLDERAAVLAHHYEEAGEGLLAARWHRRAADWVARTDSIARSRHWNRVRMLLRDLPDDREAIELAVLACGELLDVGWRIGLLPGEARDLLEEGQALAERLGDRRAELQLSMLYGRVCCGHGDMTTHVELALHNYQAALETDDVGLQAGACAWLSDAQAFASHLPQALRTAEEGLARFPRHVLDQEWVTPFSPWAMMWMWRAFCLQFMGRLKESEEAFARHRQICEEDATPEFIAYSLFIQGQLYFLTWNEDRALANAQQLEEVNRRLGDSPTLAGCSLLSFAFAHLAAGRAADAVEAARRALDHYGKDERQIEVLAAATLAEALLRTGDLPAARSAAETAIAVSARSERGHWEVLAQGVLARALLRGQGSAARGSAEAALAEAAALIERSGATTLSPFLCEWRAELAGVLGDSALEQQFLTEARHGYEAMGADRMVERLERRLEPETPVPLHS